MLRRRLVHHPRTDVLWGLLAFAVSQIALALAIDRCLPQLRDPFYAHRAERLRHSALDPKPPAATVVMLGSSRVQRGLKPSVMNERLERELGRRLVLFNFGVPACGPVTSLLYFERMRREGIKPDLLLIEVVPMLLAGRSAEGRGDLPLESQFFGANRLWHGELNFIERHGFPGDEFRKCWWQYWPVPCYGQRFAILSEYLRRLLPPELRLDNDARIDGAGWMESTAPALTPERRQAAVSQAWREHGAVLSKFHLCPAACQAQRDLLTRCREEAIAAVLVLMPEGEPFRGWYSPDALERIDRYVRSISREFAVPIVDARRWVADDDFGDGHHLLPSGAAIFTERLATDVLVPLMALDADERQEYLATWARNDSNGIANETIHVRHAQWEAAIAPETVRR
jgi:hypothetical protein